MLRYSHHEDSLATAAADYSNSPTAQHRVLTLQKTSEGRPPTSGMSSSSAKLSETASDPPSCASSKARSSPTSRGGIDRVGLVLSHHPHSRRRWLKGHETPPPARSVYWSD